MITVSTQTPEAATELGSKGTIKTPETHPEHAVVGHRFRGYCPYDHVPAVYFCDSYDPAIGYWMRREDCPPEHQQDESGKWRRNVSERAIDRTFHTIR